MAVIDDGQQQTGVASSPQQSNYEAFNPEDFKGLAENYDRDSNPYERMMPPPKGVVGVLMTPIKKDAWQKPKDNPGHFTVKVDCKIVEWVTHPQCAGIYDGYVIEHGFSSMKYRGMRTSTAAHVVAKFTTAALDNTEVLFRGIQFICKTEKVVYMMLNWKSGCKLKDGGWQNLLRDYDEFPADIATGGKQWTGIEMKNDDGKIVKVTAFPYFSEVFGRDKPTQAELKGTGGANRVVVAMPQPQQQMFNPGPVTTTPAPVQQTPQFQQPVQQVVQQQPTQVTQPTQTTTLTVPEFDFGGFN